MKGKTNKELSVDELNAKKKTLITIVVVLAVLILVYLGYLLTKLLSGTWQANNSLGIIGLGVLVVITSNLTIQLSILTKEIKSRETKDERVN